MNEIRLRVMLVDDHEVVRDGVRALLEGEEGISTLSRAFLLAGARTVISTLWSIDDDSTLYLMKAFYAELARKRPAPYALRAAKQKMLDTFGPAKAVPYYWAGFTIEGFAQPSGGR